MPDLVTAPSRVQVLPALRQGARIGHGLEFVGKTAFRIAIVSLVILTSCEPANRGFRVGVLRGERKYVVLICRGYDVSGVGARPAYTAPGKQPFFWRIRAKQGSRLLSRVEIGTTPRGYEPVRDDPLLVRNRFDVLLNPGDAANEVGVEPDRLPIGKVSWADNQVLSVAEFQRKACS